MPLSEIPEEFPDLETAARYVLYIHYKLKALRTLRYQEPRVATGTELAGLMMAKALLTPMQRTEERLRAEDEVHRAAWKRALDVVG